MRAICSSRSSARETGDPEARQILRRADNLLPPQRAVTGMQGEQAAHRAGDGGGPVGVRIGLVGRARQEFEGERLLRLGVIDQTHTAAPQTADRGHGDGERQIGGDRRVGRRTAGRQHVPSDQRGPRLVGHDPAGEADDMANRAERRLLAGAGGQHGDQKYCGQSRPHALTLGGWAPTF